MEMSKRFMVRQKKVEKPIVTRSLLRIICPTAKMIKLDSEWYGKVA